MPTVNIIYLFIIFIFYFIMALEDCFVIIRRHRNALYYLTIFCGRDHLAIVVEYYDIAGHSRGDIWP